MATLWQPPAHGLRGLQRRLFHSRFFTISVFLHLILVLTFGGTVLFRRYVEPPDFTSEGGEGFVQPVNSPQPPQQQQAQQQPTFTVTAPTAAMAPSLQAITTSAPSQVAFTLPAITTPVIGPSVNALSQQSAAASVSGGIPNEVARGIANFTGGWARGGGGGAGSSMRSREFQFTAYLAKYAGGDWASTVKLVNGKIVGGSLPNLLYIMDKLSRDKIKAAPEAIPLDLASQDLFAKRPPFVLFTGHKDFKLSDKEVENLQKYVRLGGCIWGDSSLPGRRSRFDLAFRREMRRVVPDVDKNFEPLPMTHDIFSRNPAKVYYTEINGVPPGVNYYREPLYALKIYDEIAVLYTANDYGDMWRFAITPDGKFDTVKDASGNLVLMDNRMFARREIFYRNVNEQSVLAAYKFGTNIVVHLLTRWEDKTRNVPRGL